MKKILSLILVVITVLSFGACGNEEESRGDTSNGGSNNDNGGKVIENPIVPNTPETVMDMFDGERKVWFIVEHMSSKENIAYNSPVQVVFVTENKNIVAGYFFNAFTDSYTPEYERYQLSDFDKLSDDEIISLVSQNYADISKTHNISQFYTSSFGASSYDKGNRTFNSNKLPIKIQYGGELDSSGNQFKFEFIRLIDSNSTNSDAISPFNSTYYYKKTISPTTIKNKTYIGVKFARDYAGLSSSSYGLSSIITLNTYDNFGELKLDSPDGATTLE